MEDFYEQNQLEGVVSAIIYQNEENGYTILRLDVKDEEITVVGSMPGVSPGEDLERRLPEGIREIFHYLSSGALKGVGKATARQLIEEFGDDVLNVIEEHPEQLATLRGVSLKRARQISESFRAQMGMRRLMEFLSQHAIPVEMAVPLRRAYGDVALEVLKNNPYILVEGEFGLEFSKADTLALELGVEGEDPMRLEAGLIFELAHNLNNGHTFLPHRKLLEATAALLSVEFALLEQSLDGLQQRGEVVREDIAGQEEILTANYSKLHEVAQFLLDHDYMSREQFEACMKGEPIPTEPAPTKE